MATIAERRQLVKTLWKSGTHKVTALRKLTGYPLKTLYRWTKQLKETHDLEQRSRPGRPTLLTPLQKRYLGRIAKSKKHATSAELTETLKKTYPDLNISSRTVRESLQRLGYKVCVPRSVPLLTEVAKKRRVAWAKAHKGKCWNKVIFSDESTFQMFRNTVKVRYKEGEPKPVRALVKHPFKLHVWGAFCSRRIIGFHIFEENMNGDLYREILTNNLFMQAHQILGETWEFQQDNDPKHWAKLTMDLLHERCPRLLDWPSYSPDLNPIENLWGLIKGKVEKRINIMLSEKKSITKDVFRSLIASEWEKIDENYCLKLSKSMPTRIKLVLQNKGDTIKY